MVAGSAFVERGVALRPTAATKERSVTVGDADGRELRRFDFLYDNYLKDLQILDQEVQVKLSSGTATLGMFESGFTRT